MSIQLIVGLGNPGKEYEQDRHNVGAWFVDRLCDQNHTRLATQTKLHASTAQCSMNSKTLRLATPMTYMNESGRAVRSLVQYFKMHAKNCLVVHDELDLPAGIARLKFGGGHGGHNGLRDIIQQVGSRDFWRLRVGIGHPGHKDKVSGYVLHKPSSTEQTLIDLAIETSLDQMPLLVQGHTDEATQKLHNALKETKGKV